MPRVRDALQRLRSLAWPQALLTFSWGTAFTGVGPHPHAFGSRLPPLADASRARRASALAPAGMPAGAFDFLVAPHSLMPCVRFSARARRHSQQSLGTRKHLREPLVFCARDPQRAREGFE